MTQTAWPFAGVKATETQYSQQFRRLQNSGVWGDPGDETLKVVANVGLGLYVKSGYAFVRGHLYYNDSDTQAVTIGTASANPRQDLVVLRLDPAANTILPVVVAGTPAASNPVVPTPVQTDAANYDIPLASVFVAAGQVTIANSDITDRRLFMGHIYGSWTTTTRPGTAGSGSPAPRKGQPGFNSTTGLPEYWDGSTWKEFAPSSYDPALLASAVPVNKGGTGSTTAAAARTALGITPANIGAQVAGSYAAASHNHDGSDVTTGTVAEARLPVSSVAKGGTGATSAAAARTNLGVPTILLQNSTPAAGTAGRLWGKIPV